MCARHILDSYWYVIPPIFPLSFYLYRFLYYSFHFFLKLVKLKNFIVGSHSNHAMGSDCFWPTCSCRCSCCFSGFLPCVFYSIWPFYVVGWNDFWIWHWLCYNYGWNNYWNGPTLFDWPVVPKSHPCKFSVIYRMMLNHWSGKLYFDCLLPLLSVTLFPYLYSNGWRDGPSRLKWLDLQERAAGSINFKW